MREKFKVVTTVTVLVAVLLFVLPGVSLAKENPAKKGVCTGVKKKTGTETVTMEGIVVTATRTKTAIMNAPSNISVITAKDIRAMDAKNVAEALRKIPGVYYTNASGLEPKISLRGTRIGMSGGALVLVNGIPMNMGKFGYTDFEAIPVDNIERVEVVKGPMSALYGGNSARGVINIITKRSPKPLKGEISAIIGSYNDQRYSALGYGSRGRFDYNLNLKRRKQNGYRHKTYLDNNYLNGELGFWLNNDIRIGAYLNVANKNRQLAKKLTEVQRYDARRQAPDYSDTNNSDIITGLNLDIKKELFDCKTIFYYKKREKEYKNYLKATSTPYHADLDEDVYGIRSIFTLKIPLFTLKNRFSVGLDYDYDHVDLRTFKASSKTPGAPYTKPDPKKSGDFKRKELGLFIQEELLPITDLTITAGLRYDYFGFDNDADYDFTRGGTYDYDDTPSYDKLNPRVGINYRVLDNLSFFANYSRAYRAPTIYDYYASGSYSAKNAYTLKPETFTQYETGMRCFFSHWLTVNATVYHIDIEDMLDSAYDKNGRYMGKQNVGEVTIEGAELTLSGTPFDWLNYRIGYAYTSAKYSDHVFAKVNRTTTVDINHNRLTKVPRNTLNIDLNTRLFRWHGYRLLWYVNLQAQDEFPMDKANTAYYHGYTLVNTKLRLEHKNFEAFISADNLFNKDYDGYAYRSYGKNYYYPAAGVTFAGGISYRF